MQFGPYYKSPVAGSVPFDPSGTTLTSEDVQGAIEELASLSSTFDAEFDTDVGTSVGDFLNVVSDGTVARVFDNLPSTIPNGIVGVGFYKPSSLRIRVISTGLIGGFSGLVINRPVFVGTDGLPTQTPPVTGMIQQVGIAVSPTQIYLHLMQPMRRS